MAGDLEEVTTNCPECGKPVVTYWHKDNTGCEPSEMYVLIADWVLHRKCWDKMLERNPPS